MKVSSNPIAFLIVLLSLLTSVYYSPCIRAAEDDARLESVEVPRYMVSGESYLVSIVFKNIGTSNWSSEDNYRLGWADGNPAEVSGWKMELPQQLFEASVAPGESAILNFEIIAPESKGRFTLAWQLRDADGKPFGEQASVAGVRVEQPDNQSRVVMQLVPDELSAGEQFTALIQMKNIGRTTWSSDQGYHLAAVDSSGWQVKRLELPVGARIAPGETATFKARLVAPSVVGMHRLQWQMRHKESYFGDTTTVVMVRVGKQVMTALEGEFVYQNVSKVMLAGESHAVVLQFKNTSQETWSAGEVTLVSPSAKGLLWAIDSVELKPGEKIEPGEFVVFRFNVQAPFEPGRFPFQWQLRHSRDGLFGEPSERLLIEVK